MKTTLISLSIAACFGLSTTVSADDAYQGSWYAVPGIGIMHADSDLKTESNGPAGFLRFGKALSDHWDVQLGLSHTKLDSDNSLNGLNLDGDYKQTLLGLDALYMFSRDKFRPFVLAGLGYARNNIDYKLAGINIGDQNNSWMANVGAGFQYFFTDNIGLQADLRHVWSRAEAKAHVAGFEVASSDTVGNTYLNLGLVFNFGAPAKTVAAAPAPAMEEVAAHEEEALPPLVDESLTPQPEVVGPAQPVFERMTLQAEVLFAFDKDSLKDNGKHILDVEVVEKMRAHPEVELVLITGHTDRIGDDKYNQKLSERRANQVKKYIASQGIAESRLHAVGKGEKEPVADCKGVRGKKLIECLQPNRRVVVEIEAQRQTGQ